MQIKKFRINIILKIISGVEMKQKTYTITKKIAKHGSQAIIVIPRVLEQHLKPGTTVQITMDILENLREDGK